jgi:ComF family protein
MANHLPMANHLRILGTGLGAFAAPLQARVLDMILPPRCLSCGKTIARGGDVCGTCWRGLSFISGAMCVCCGLPFELDIGAGALCGPCLAQTPLIHRARAALVYDEASKALVLPFKHADRLDCAPAFARWMARAGAELLASGPIITAIPLHRRRLLTRRYNQAAVLALALGTLTGQAAIPDLLQRHRPTPSQGGLSAQARRTNVRGAFRINPRHQNLVSGRHILLVDDVHTTGATLDEAARTLLAGGGQLRLTPWP